MMSERPRYFCSACDSWRHTENPCGQDNCPYDAATLYATIAEALDNAVKNGCMEELSKMSAEDIAYDLARHDANCERMPIEILKAGVAAWQHPQGPSSLGLSVDMLDVDRLRDWARNIDTHGPNLMQWGSPSFLVDRLSDMANRLETTVREIGILRKAAPGSDRVGPSIEEQVKQLPRRIEPLGGQQTSYVQLDSVLALIELRENHT